MAWMLIVAQLLRNPTTGSLCRLCGTKMRSDWRALACSHRYHAACLDALVQRGCGPVPPCFVCRAAPAAASPPLSKPPPPALDSDDGDGDGDGGGGGGGGGGGDDAGTARHHRDPRHFFDRGVMYAVQAGAAVGSAARRALYRKACEALHSSIAIDPARAATHANMGVVLCGLGDLEGAMESCQRARR